MTSTIATALETVSAAITANPEKARAKYAPATATLADGLKCRVIGPSGESIETDMGKAMGGTAQRQTPAGISVPRSRPAARPPSR